VSVSLDGFVAQPDDTVGPLFDWYASGEVEVPSADPRWSFQVSPASAEVLCEALDQVGALVCGRRLFEVAHGWEGNHPTGAPVFVVTHHPPQDWDHPEAPFTFVTDGLADAIARASAVAGDRWIAVASANLIQQGLAAGLIDELHLDLVQVLLGTGIRLFDALPPDVTLIRLTGPEVVEGQGVTHLRYRLT
jgi:dihydrofolate reductase